MSSQNSIASNEEIPPNTLIHSRYLIQQILGQGGLGKTYLALDTHRFNEPCVLKEFAPFGSGNYDLEKSRNLFKREAKILHQITHPQIPKFLACFEDKKGLFLVQEYVDGKTYSALLEERQQSQQVFTESEVVGWLMNLLPILDYIHQQGIIHRDISPDNIMQPQGSNLPVLIDFGVGKLRNLPQKFSHNGFQKTSYVGKISFVGKVGYAPREQIIMGRCSPSSDIYALGVTALVLLTGKDPTALVNQLSLEWQWQKYAQVSPKLKQILSQMTEEKPLKRYQSAQEVIQDLQKLASNTEPTVIARQSAPPKSSPPKSNSDDTILLRPAPAPSPVSRPPVVDETFIVTTGANSAPQPPVPQKPTTDSSSNSTPSIDSTMIISSVNPAPQSEKLRSQNNSFSQSIKPEFIRRCEQELGFCIGPLASLVVQEVMQKQQPQSPKELINALADYITDRNQVRKFKRRF